ncbi:zinc-dependent metalloprotease [Larkinella arboricola]
MKPFGSSLAAMYFVAFFAIQAAGQTPVCSTPPPTRAFGQALLELERQYLRQQAGKRLTDEVTDVAIRVNVMQFSNGDGPVTQPQVDTCIAYLNQAFLLAGIRFHLDGQVNFVKDDRWASLTNNDEVQAMRRLYDVNQAINLYMISNPLTSSSYAMFPNNSASSNFIFINSFSDFENLCKYLLPHEFGHYFGLFHPFETGMGRELVTRGPEANCETTGDLICDTPADPTPYGNCFRSYDSDTKVCERYCRATDERGEVYAPDFDNFMSYFTPFCPANYHFTPGQYLRMKVGLQFRLRETCVGKERYSVTGTLPDTYMLADSLYGPAGGQAANNPLAFCRNATVYTSFTPVGSFQPDNEFKVAIWASDRDMLVRKVTEVSAAAVPGKPHTLAFSIPEALKELTVYQVQVVSTHPALSGCLNSKIVNIIETPTVRLAAATTSAESITVGFGEAVPVRVTTESEGYQKLTLRINDQVIPFFEAGVTSWKQVETDYQTPVRFFKNSSVEIQDVRVPCGNARVNGKLTVIVRSPVLKTQLPAGFSVCAGRTISVPFQSDIPTEVMAGNYLLQLSDQNGQFADDSTNIIGESRTGAIQAVLPSSLPMGSGYRTRLMIRTPQGQIVGEPGPPLTVRPRPQATVTSEPVSIYVADSTRLTIAFTGEPPWSYTLSNGQSFTASQSPATVVVKPVETTAYRVTTVQNACGVGTASGSTTVTVLKPLGSPPVYSGTLTVRLWPNPSQNRVYVEWTEQPGRTVNLAVINPKGQVLRTIPLRGTGLPQQQEINVSLWPAGSYVIRATGSRGHQTLRFMVYK